MKPTEKTISGFLLILGVVLRLRQYLSGRSLWADEAMLALNIVNRDFVGLFRPLDYDQGTPLGFLLVEKWFNLLLGRHELVLRFFPLLAGLASLWLFYLLAKRTLQGVGYYLALALFAINPALVDYSSEAKQYILDVAVILGLLLLAFPILKRQGDQRKYIFLALGGIVALWFSHASLFVLAGIGIALILTHLQSREYSSLRLPFGMGTLWLVNLGLLYVLNLRQLRANTYLATYWANGFIPMPPWSVAGGVSTYFSELIQFQFEIFFLPLLVLVLMVAGWYLLYRDDRPLALVFALTTLFAFIASALRLYPVSGRLSLFLIPPGIILLGKFLEFIQKALATNKMAFAVTTAVIVGYLVINPLIESSRNFISPKYYEHIRPTMQVLADSWKDGDVLFVTAWAEPAFRFYAPFYGLERVEITSSEIEDYPDGEKLKSRIDPLIGQKRVWALFSHVYEQGGFNERDFLVAYLDQIGVQRREILRPGTSVYLFFYDLSR